MPLKYLSLSTSSHAHLIIGLFTFIAPCPSGCECLEWGTCNWSIAGAELIASLPKNDSMWQNQAEKIKKYTCNAEMHGICCCGNEQLAPDLGEP